MEKKFVSRVLTGMRTTGQLHLGHYVGAIKLWLTAQETGADCFFLLADVQALTTHADQPQMIKNSIREVALDWIAAGIDPNRPNVHFVLQSGVRARFEISQYLMMIATLGEIERNPTVKDEMRGRRNPSMGFLTYPVDQAADIYMVSPKAERGNSLLVPVGADQAPHLEYARKLARRFNDSYKTNVFLPCEASIGEVGRLVGVDGQEKMSKSKGNSIDLVDTAEVVTKKVMRMYTDPNRLRPTDPGTVKGNPLFIYFDAFAEDKEEVEEYKRLYALGQIGDVVLKKRLAEVLNQVLEPMRQRRANARKISLHNIIESGTLAASKIANEVLGNVKNSMFLGIPD